MAEETVGVLKKSNLKAILDGTFFAVESPDDDSKSIESNLYLN